MRERHSRWRGQLRWKILWNIEESMGRLLMLEDRVPGRAKGKMLLERRLDETDHGNLVCWAKSLTCHIENWGCRDDVHQHRWDMTWWEITRKFWFQCLPSPQKKKKVKILMTLCLFHIFYSIISLFPYSLFCCVYSTFLSLLEVCAISQTE